MTELTPELLAQLEFLVDAGENFPLPLQSVTVRALVAAAKERDQLQRQVGGSSLGAMRREVQQLRAKISGLEERQQVHLAQIAKLSQSTPLAEELTGWEDQRAKMIAEVGTLRVEVDRLRRLGLDAVDRAEDYRDYVCNSQEKAIAETKRIRAEIERKP